MPAARIGYSQRLFIRKTSSVTLLAVWLLLSQAVYAQQPDLFLLKTYDGSQDVAGWVMSEKLDGVRGVWDGERLLSRGGNALHAPQWFVRDFPPFALGGELWTKCFPWPSVWRSWSTGVSANWTRRAIYTKCRKTALSPILLGA